jgi:hypothetical protein
MGGTRVELAFRVPECAGTKSSERYKVGTCAHRTEKARLAYLRSHFEIRSNRNDHAKVRRQRCQWSTRRHSFVAAPSEPVIVLELVEPGPRRSPPHHQLRGDRRDFSDRRRAALAKMSAYDLIVSITLGALVASIPFLDKLSLTDGLAAIVTLVVLQELIRWAQARSHRVRAMLAEHPRIVVWNGKLLDERLQRWNLTGREVRAAIRKQGIAHVEEVQAVVLENDGEWSVIRRGKDSDRGSAFENLDVPDE